ncbi:MAG: putative multidrug export transporter,permease component [Naasia sp.]|jgi:lipooligosaccharide transport system permease protein|uniref:ABC transporter permease n=1 Tax=Naasia sp. TaxID=2546198 RepID=UPI0026367B3E|nr:ABC transporter permease [Naasia sp.]MCU1570621.1 putative multidrug export transporter,permease component [Naasia sp.]
MTAVRGGRVEARAARRARRYGTWYATEYRLRLMRAYGGTILAGTLANPLIYIFALGVGLATLVEQKTGPLSAGGHGYLAFVAPALLGIAALTVAMEESTYAVMAGFKWDQTFFAMNAAPLSPAQVASGNVVIVILRLLVGCSVYQVLLFAFGAVPSPWGWLTVLVAVLCGTAVAACLVAFSSSLEGEDSPLALVMRFVITPMMLFSGTFFPLANLPVFLQPIGWVSPLWHATELGRVLNYGAVEPAWLSVLHVAYLLALTAVGWLLAIRVTTSRLSR